MSRRPLALLAVPVALGVVSWPLARPQEKPHVDFPAYEVAEPPAKGLATLWASDPEARAISFADGLPGAVIQAGGVYNRQSDLDFDNYAAGCFSVGIEGGREGIILDLGTADELRARHGYPETLGGGQGFASLAWVDGLPMIRAGADSDGQGDLGGGLQPLQGAGELLEEPEGVDVYRADRSRKDRAPVHVDHVYLLRLWDRHEPDFERVVKLLVLDHDPGRSVTLRWVRIAG